MAGWFVATIAVLATLMGGGVILWWIRKPMVHLTKMEWAGWYYSYRIDVPTDIMVDVGVVLQNTGETGSYVLTGLEPGLGTEHNGATWKEGNKEIIDGRGQLTEITLSFPYPIPCKLPTDTPTLTGTLHLKPWGTRKCPLMKSVIQRPIEIPYSDKKCIERIFSPS